MTSAYRTPAERVVERHAGPRYQCPKCGANTREQDMDIMGKVVGQPRFVADCRPRYCGPGQRRGGWLCRCKLEGEHLHQSCRVCHAEWICDCVAGES